MQIKKTCPKGNTIITFKLSMTETFTILRAITMYHETYQEETPENNILKQIAEEMIEPITKTLLTKIK